MIRIWFWPISEIECPDPDNYRIRIRPLEKKFVKHKLNTEYILGLGDKLSLLMFQFRIRILSFWAIRIR